MAAVVCWRPALRGFGRPVILIAGGDGKGADFSPLRDGVAACARHVVLIGRDGPLVGRAIKGAAPFTEVASMADAITLAKSMAQPGDTVLLAPACASFDMYPNFARRGEHFKSLVRELT